MIPGQELRLYPLKKGKAKEQQTCPAGRGPGQRFSVGSDEKKDKTGFGGNSDALFRGLGAGCRRCLVYEHFIASPLLRICILL